LYEIHSGSRDTHNLAVAAGKQESHTEEIAQAAQDQVDAANEISDAADQFSDTATVAVEEFKSAASQASVAATKQAGAAVQQAQAAKSQSETLKASLVASQNQFRTEQRPLLFANPRGAFPADKTKQPNVDWNIFAQNSDGSVQMAVAVEFRNGGKSTAVHVANTQTAYIIAPTDDAVKQARNFIPDYPPEESAVVAPSAGFVPVSPQVKLDKNVVDHYNDGSWTIFVVGGVRYTDLFEPPMESYETTYCWHINPTGLAFAECSFGKGYFSSSIK
jgi:hypothetical protein